MRHISKERLPKARSGFDRTLLAVAATFLMVSAGSALAQSTPKSAAELAIEAAVPVPEPVNLPPPTAKDFKPVAPTPDVAKAEPVKADPAKSEPAKTAERPAQPAESKPAEQAAAPASVTPAPDTTASTTPAAPAATASPAPASTASTQPSAPAAASPASTPAPSAAQAPAGEPVKAASAVPEADQPVADKVRDLLASKSLRMFDRKGEKAAVEKFYAERQYAPLWTSAGKPSDLAKSVIARLGAADDDGLEASDYPVPDFTAASTPDALAEAELKLTSSMLDYARQAQSGRMHWSQVSGDIQYPEHPVDPTEVLTHVTTAKDASAALESYNPPQKLYRELKAKLAELRGKGDGPVITIAEGPSLRYIKTRKKEIAPQDPRVPQLRAKLGIENADDDHYDEKVATAVRKFQSSVSLKPTGILDARTVNALNHPKKDREIDTIIVNMERWRWLPRDLGAPSLGDAYVILNIPDFTLKVMQHGKQVWKTRVVTGKPGVHATPLLYETMKFITVNPTWNVPPSIVYNEYLPALQQDPTVLQRMGLKLEYSRDGTPHISQPPGDRNALGRIRFNFPNKFLVYQHDTPDKYLFAKDYRAYSHGCMRVQNPDVYAATLLNITKPGEHWTPERIRSMFGSNETNIQFPTPIPVNITYQTAFVDEAGKLEFRADLYGRDATMLKLLRNPRGRDLEQVIAHSQPSYSRPTPPPRVATADSTPNFFEMLFGPRNPPPPPPPQRRIRHGGPR